MRPSSLAPAAKLAADKPHGTRIRYVGGCRCLPCRAANSSYEAMRARERREGNWNGIVSAERARAHIDELARQGLGRRAVADASGIGVTCIQKIKSGRKRRIRRETERLILAVTKGAIKGGSRVPARRTWAYLNHLLGLGLTRGELARRLGSRAATPILQVRRDFVKAATEARAKALYLEVVGERLAAASSKMSGGVEVVREGEPWTKETVERLCMRCPLADCADESPRCLIRIARRRDQGLDQSMYFDEWAAGDSEGSIRRREKTSTTAGQH